MFVDVTESFGNCASQIQLEVYLEENDFFMRSTTNNMPFFELEATYDEMEHAEDLINAIENEDLSNNSVFDLFPGFKSEKLDEVPCSITDTRGGSLVQKTIILKRRDSKDSSNSASSSSSSSSSSSCYSEPSFSSSSSSDE